MWAVYRPIEALLVPGLRFAADEYADTLLREVPKGATWVDLGCGHQLFEANRAQDEAELTRRAHMVVGLDPVEQALSWHKTIARRVAGKLEELPFRDNTFDLATANMVVEHLDQPEVQFREVLRVLKPGGRFIFHTPNTSGYSTQLASLTPEGLKKKIVRVINAREAHDVFLTHYRANTEAQIRQVAATSGFAVQEVRLIRSTAELVVIPFAPVLELMWIRALSSKRLRHLRPNIIAILEKP